VRVALDHSREHESEWAAITSIADILKLSIVVSSRSIRRSRLRRHLRPPSRSWRASLDNHAQTICTAWVWSQLIEATPGTTNLNF
jgi:hypothetical protein